jgi:signal transduction histidine kinase
MVEDILMPEFTIPDFNRRYVLLPMLAAIAVVVTAFFVTETRRSQVMSLATDVRRAQEGMQLLVELAYAAADAESSQRGFLLTQNQQYLQPYEKARQLAAGLISAARTAYQGNAQETPHVAQIARLLDEKFAEMNATLELAQSSGSADKSLQLVKTNVGLNWMTQMRDEIEAIRYREREHIYRGIIEWRQQHTISRYLAGAETILTIILLLVAGAYITRDITRRTDAARELDRQVAQRTRELSELSTHQQGLIEREKSQLARELHDELGGLLVSIKMDLAQVARKLDVKHPDVQARWQRVQEALNAGVDLKRRVIEELRPSLLDNMGIAAAVQWQATQTCTQAGIALQGSFPEAEPVLDANVAIAIFRVAQEALTNMVKHARATQATVELECSDAALLLTIEDNGVGIAENRSLASGSHGLLSIKHRAQAIGGSIHIGSALRPSAIGRGTRIVVRLPLDIANAIATLA